MHLHHYLWVILLLAAVAVFGLVDRSPRTRSWMGAALGVALGLIVDEAALLITLEDVYWHTEGWSSIALAITIIGAVGTGLVLTRSGATLADRRSRSVLVGYLRGPFARRVEHASPQETPNLESVELVAISRPIRQCRVDHFPLRKD